MTLSEIDSKIDQSMHGVINGGTTVGRKSFFKRLIWLEANRSKVHGIDTPGVISEGYDQFYCVNFVPI